jgi:hypothetical protein
MPTVLALGLDPAFVTFPPNSGLTPELVRAFIGAQLDLLRGMGYTVQDCLVDPGETADDIVSRQLKSASFDCVMFGAGLRAPEQLLLFERLLNLVHAQAPNAKICFNTSPGDTAEAVKRWV